MALKASKLRDLSPAELDKEVKDLRDQIWKLQVQKSTGQAQDPHRLRLVKRDLARVLTIRRERELSDARGKAR